MIGNDNNKPDERCALTAVDEVHKLVPPLRYIPDALFSLLRKLRTHRE